MDYDGEETTSTGDVQKSFDQTHLTFTLISTSESILKLT